MKRNVFVSLVALILLDLFSQALAQTEICPPGDTTCCSACCTASFPGDTNSVSNCQEHCNGGLDQCLLDNPTASANGCKVGISFANGIINVGFQLCCLSSGGIGFNAQGECQVFVPFPGICPAEDPNCCESCCVGKFGDAGDRDRCRSQCTGGTLCDSTSTDPGCVIGASYANEEVLDGQCCLDVGDIGAESDGVCLVTPDPTAAPTSKPTQAPTGFPTSKPTTAPTAAPTKEPTTSPTRKPTKNPTNSPTKNPTKGPTTAPTKNPTKNPTMSPTKNPTTAPTKNPTKNPTSSPTKNPTKNPTENPTASPTKNPTKKPTTSPTKNPTGSPTTSPTKNPTTSPTQNPTKNPTTSPTKNPTKNPTETPTKAPTTTPTASPIGSPTSSPTSSPTVTEAAGSIAMIGGIVGGVVLVGLIVGAVFLQRRQRNRPESPPEDDMKVGFDQESNAITPTAAPAATHVYFDGKKQHHEGNLDGVPGSSTQGISAGPPIISTQAANQKAAGKGSKKNDIDIEAILSTGKQQNNDQNLDALLASTSKKSAKPNIDMLLAPSTSTKGKKPSGGNRWSLSMFQSSAKKQQSTDGEKRLHPKISGLRKKKPQQSAQDKEQKLHPKISGLRKNPGQGPRGNGGSSKLEDDEF